MKISLKNIWVSAESLDKLLHQNLGAKNNYWISKQAKKVIKEIELIDEQRIKLVEKYGEKQPDDSFKVAENKLVKFDKEFQKFLETEIELEVEKIKFEMVEKSTLDGNDFLQLDFLIEEPVEPTEPTEPTKDTKE